MKSQAVFPKVSVRQILQNDNRVQDELISAFSRDNERLRYLRLHK